MDILSLVSSTSFPRVNGFEWCRVDRVCLAFSGPCGFSQHILSQFCKILAHLCCSNIVGCWSIQRCSSMQPDCVRSFLPLVWFPSFPWQAVLSGSRLHVLQSTQRSHGLPPSLSGGHSCSFFFSYLWEAEPNARH